MRKSWVIVAVVVGLVACIGTFVFGLVSFVFSLTSGLTDSAEKFFAAAANKDDKALSEVLSRNFQTDTSLDSLNKYLTENNLRTVESTFWNSRSIENSSGRLVGTVTLESGVELPMTMTFRKEGDVWKINSIKREQGGLVN